MATAPIKPRVLCLDGGGIRGLSEILILKELMLQVRVHNGLDYTPEPQQCFNFICGTSSGGLIALLLGRLGKTLNECEELFRKFRSDTLETSSLWKTYRLILKGSKHADQSLADAVGAQAGDGSMFDEEAPANGHVSVAVVLISKTTKDDYLFRTYGIRAITEACPILDVCRAATSLFSPITINGVDYIDGVFKNSNPSTVALAELESSEWISPMKDAVTGVECFVSVGSGRPTTKKAEKPGLVSKLIPGIREIREAVKLGMRIATDCHRVHLEVENKFRKAGVSEAYHRFDVGRGLESVLSDENDQETLQHISAATKSYLKEKSAEIERCAKLIVPISIM